jgi:FMN phosphatase YigB (HAD superfamily)
MTQNLTQKDIDVVVFDLGGVLIDIDFQRVFKHWAELAGCDVKKLINRFSMDHHYEMHERGEITASEYFAALRDNLEIHISDAQILEGWNRVFVGEVPRIRHIVQQYAELFPVYVFSNTNEAHKSLWLEDYADLLKPFAGVFISCEIGKRKPEVEAYQHVAAAVGAEPSRILFFDDSAQNVEGARQVGLLARKVDSVADVEKILKGLVPQ